MMTDTMVHRRWERATVNQQLTVQMDNSEKISSQKAKEKAKLELQKYKALNLDTFEKDYLKTIASLEKKAKAESRKKGGQV